MSAGIWLAILSLPEPLELGSSSKVVHFAQLPAGVRRPHESERRRAALNPVVGASSCLRLESILCCVVERRGSYARFVDRGSLVSFRCRGPYLSEWPNEPAVMKAEEAR